MNTRAMAFFIMLAATLSLVSSAKADSVSVTLTGVSGGIQGNVYTSPYYATVGNTANVPIVCDDYSHEVYMGESWTAAVSTFADLSNTRFWQGTEAATLQLYGAAAYLFNELFSQPASQSGDISFALWAVFDPGQVKSSAGWDSNAAWWLNAAESQTYTAAEFSNLEILTPQTCPQSTTSGCTAQDYAASPQEYFVQTPEPSAALLLGIGLCAALILKRSKNWASVRI